MKLSQFLDVVEIKTKIVSVSTFFIAVFYLLWHGVRIDALKFALLLPAVLSLDMGTTAFNNFFDFRSGVDKSAALREKEKNLVHEGLGEYQVGLAAFILFGITAVLGLILVFLTNWRLLALGLVCMLIGFCYSGGPFPISRGPFGDLFAGGSLGSALFLFTIFTFKESLHITDFLVSVPSLLIIASILTVNNNCDILGDKAGGRKTLSILIGVKAGEVLVYILNLGAYAALTANALRGNLPRTVLYTAAPAVILSIPFYIRMHKNGFSHAAKIISMNGISLLFIIFTLSVLAGLIIALF